MDTINFENYLKTLSQNEFEQLYNLQNTTEMKPQLIQFKQLINFFNFKRFLNEELSKDNNNENVSNDNNDKKRYYLIDKDWVQEWKKHVGFNKVKEKFDKYHLNRDLNDSDDNWIGPIISKYSKDNKLYPLNNNTIYQNNNNINPLGNFIIVDENCYKLFTLGSNNNKEKEKEEQSFQIKILKEKIIIEFNESTYLLIYKNSSYNKYYELLIYFKDNSQMKSILKDIIESDINEWIKTNKINFDSNDKFTLENKYDIINKTLKLNKIKDNMNQLSKNNKGTTASK